MPDLARLSPGRGLKRVLSVSVLLEAGKSLPKMGVVAWAGWYALAGALPDLPQAMIWDPGTLADR
jgi:flagellar biosynthesis protein FlhB